MIARIGVNFCSFENRSYLIPKHLIFVVLMTLWTGYGCTWTRNYLPKRIRFKIIIGSGSDHNYCENIQLALFYIEISRRRS
jgi:hypothetical protein